MGRNNQRRKTNIEQRNFKLYKHKKQWMTACATFLLTFGATAVMNVSASANTDNISNGNSTPKNAEVVKAALTNEEQSNNAQQVNEMPADSKKQTATASTVDQSTAKQTTAVKDRQEQTVATQPSESVNSSKDTNHSATVATSPVSSATHPTSSADTAQSNGEQSESTVVTSQTTPGKAAETNQADNKDAETTTPKSGSTASQKANPVTPHAASTENIAPDPYTMDGDSQEPPYVIAGTNLTDLASKFLKNGDALLQSGAKISWVGDVPTPTQQDAGSTISGTIKVTYADGNYYYYELNANVNVAQKVTFEFVDQYNNNAVVGQTYSQEFIPGAQTNLNFNMTIPTDPEGYGYELANGTSIPSQYTLPAYTQTPVVVQVPIHQKMHFNIRFHDEDSNTDLGTVDISGFTAGNGGYDPNAAAHLKLPKGASVGNYYSVSTSGVPKGVTLMGSSWTPLTNPDATWYIPNYKWEKTEAVEKALTGTTMTINLKHKINTTQEQQTRTATVNYVKAKVNADGTYTQDGNVTQSAVLDVCYSRNKYEDQVTKKITYSPWLWDTNQGQNGYHVVSGKWTSLPTSWGAVVADVPTVDGYTAAVITDKSGKPANEFVYPTWNTTGADGNTDPAQASQAYTKDTTAYEAQPVHTVLYIPVQTEARTITAKFIIAGGDKDGQDFAPASQVQIFYNRIGSLNIDNNIITYGNWQWDNAAGNSNTPGFKVLSGSWSLPTEPNQSWSVNTPSAGSDYVMAKINSAGSYTTNTFGAPAYNSNTTFTNSTANQWFMRNELTTYYVPKSLVNKTVTRTITITEPGEATRTFSTDTVVLNRPVKVNNDDTGVVFAGFDGSGWNTQSWMAITNLPAHEGYTMSATKTVNGVTTPIQLVNGQVPAETVTDATQDTTINITWGAVATATLTGNGESTYNGQAITNGELNKGLKVTITGPTAGSGTYTLQNGDVEFSIDGTTWSTNMPINAGKY